MDEFNLDSVGVGGIFGINIVGDVDFIILSI